MISSTEIRNFRDLGGLKVKNGVIKPRKLLRGGALHKLDSKTWDTLLTEYKLKTVIDLRTAAEREKEPNNIVPQVHEIHIDLMSQAQENADPNEMAKKFNLEVSQDHMRSLNRMFVEDDSCRDEFRSFFRVLLNSHSGATYFHCTAGKDRTGFAAAQILKILGASDKTVFEDYMRTNQLTSEFVENRLQEIKKREHLSDMQIDNIRGYMTVDPSYLKEAFLAIDERYGTFENYVRHGLNLTIDDVQKLQDFYVELDR